MARLKSGAAPASEPSFEVGQQQSSCGSLPGTVKVGTTAALLLRLQETQMFLSPHPFSHFVSLSSETIKGKALFMPAPFTSRSRPVHSWFLPHSRPVPTRVPPCSIPVRAPFTPRSLSVVAPVLPYLIPVHVPFPPGSHPVHARVMHRSRSIDAPFTPASRPSPTQFRSLPTPGSRPSSRPIPSPFTPGLRTLHSWFTPLSRSGHSPFSKLKSYKCLHMKIKSLSNKILKRQSTLGM